MQPRPIKLYSGLIKDSYLINGIAKQTSPLPNMSLVTPLWRQVIPYHQQPWAADEKRLDWFTFPLKLVIVNL